MGTPEARTVLRARTPVHDDHRGWTLGGHNKEDAASTHRGKERDTQAKVTAEVEKSLGNLSEVFTGNRTVEGETSPTDPTRNVALWWLDNDDVESWCDKVPIDILTEWFLHPDHKEKFFNKMVREGNNNFMWTTALAWAADYYPLYGHGDTQGDPAGR